MIRVYGTPKIRQPAPFIDRVYCKVIRSWQRQEPQNEETAMTDLPPYPGTPRWVRIAGIITLVVVVLVGITHLSGVAPSDHTPPIEHGVRQP
jgi:hypothetical protein